MARIEAKSGSRNEEQAFVARASRSMGYRKINARTGNGIVFPVFSRVDKHGRWLSLVFEDTMFDTPSAAQARAESRADIRGTRPNPLLFRKRRIKKAEEDKLPQSKSLKQYYKTEEGKVVIAHVVAAIMKRTTIQPTVLPLVKQGLAVDEIMERTKFSRQQVESAIRILRHKGTKEGGLERPSEEQTNKLLSRATSIENRKRQEKKLQQTGVVR